MKQVFSLYDPNKLTVLCDAAWLSSAEEKCPKSLISCRHETVESRLSADLRPRSYFNKVRQVLNLQRVNNVFELGSKIIHEQGIEALMLPLHSPEFAIAGYRLHKAFGIPFYAWESDDWEAMYKDIPFVCSAVVNIHPKILTESRIMWMVSYSMIDLYRNRYSIEGRFLHNFVDIGNFASFSLKSARNDHLLKIVYTGAINQMFASTVKLVCEWINRGIVVGGRQVSLTLHTTVDTSDYCGPHVHSGGFVPHDEIPCILADADVLLSAVTFDGQPEVMSMVRTSIYTKTIEYLASGRPVLYVGPPDAAQFLYFSEVMQCVTTKSFDSFLGSLGELSSPSRASTLCKDAILFLEKNHGMRALHQNVLNHFIVHEDSCCEEQ